MNILTMSISGGAVILAVLLVRMLTRGKLPRRLVLLLWGVVIIRLLVPFSLPFEYSVYSFFPRETGYSQPVIPEISEPLEGELDKNPVGNSAPDKRQDETSTRPAAAPDIDWVAAAYYGVGASLLCGYAVYGIIWRRRFSRYSADVPEDDCAYALLQSVGCKRRIKIKLCGKTASPLTYGVLRPAILLPEGADRKDIGRLGCVLLHEYMHVKNLDILKKSLLALTVCVHWFNPLVWVMFFAASRDIEIACDEAVIERMGDSSRKSYALALLDMEESRQSFAVFSNAFGRNAVEERVKMIIKGTRRSVATILVSVLTVAAAFAFFATSALAKTEPVKSAEQSAEASEQSDEASGEIGWPAELLPEGFPAADYSQIYSVETKDEQVTVILFGTDNQLRDFLLKVYNSGYAVYDDAATGERFIVNRDGCRVSVAKSDEWTGEHLKSINAQSPTGFTFEIKVARIDAPAECLFWQYPDASADLGLEPTVFTEWPTEYLPEGFVKPDAGIEILEMKREKNGLFITLKGELRAVGNYETEIFGSVGYINTANAPVMNPNGDYMYIEELDFQSSGSAYTVTVRLQICPANDLIIKP